MRGGTRTTRRPYSLTIPATRTSFCDRDPTRPNSPGLNAKRCGTWLRSGSLCPATPPSLATKTESAPCGTALQSWCKKMPRLVSALGTVSVRSRIFILLYHAPNLQHHTCRPMSGGWSSLTYRPGSPVNSLKLVFRPFCLDSGYRTNIDELPNLEPRAHARVFQKARSARYSRFSRWK